MRGHIPTLETVCLDEVDSLLIGLEDTSRRPRPRNPQLVCPGRRNESAYFDEGTFFIVDAEAEVTVETLGDAAAWRTLLRQVLGVEAPV